MNLLLIRKSWLNLALWLLPCMLAAQPCEVGGFVANAANAMRSGNFSMAEKQASEGLACAETGQYAAARFDLLLLRYESLRSQRKFKEALAAAKDAQAFFTKTKTGRGHLPLEIALAEAFAMQRDSLNCLKHLHVAQSLAKNNPSQTDQAWLRYIEGYWLQHFLKKPEAGVAAYRQALQGLQNGPPGQVFLQGQILRWLGNTTRSQGDFPQALAYYEQELALYQKHYPPTQADVAICHYNLGGVHYELLNYQKALDHYLPCYAVWKNTYEPGSTYFRFLTEAMGDMYWELGDRPQALEFYDRSVAGVKPEQRDSSTALSDTADSLARNGQYGEALGYYRQALAFRERNFGKKHPLTVACQNFVGRAYQAAGKTTEALGAYQQSILMLTEGPTHAGSLENMPVTSIQPLLEALAGKGELLLQRAENGGSGQDLQAALETLELAVSYLEQFRRSPMSDASKLFWNRRSLPILENAIRSAVLLHRQSDEEKYLEAAFRFSEKSRAFLLLAALQGNEAATFSGVPEAWSKREQALKNQVLDYEGKILAEERRCAEARQKQLELWREKWQALRLEYDALLGDLQRNCPAYFSLKFGAQTVGPGVLKKLLHKSDAAMLEFFEGSHYVYVFYIDPARLRVFEVKKDSLYEANLAGLIALLPDKNKFLRQPQEAYLGYTEAAFWLYRVLLEKPLRECPPEVERLLIVPGQRLSLLPFGCLLTGLPQPPQAGRDYRGLPYLLRRYRLVYAPSATVWHEMAMVKKPGRAARTYAGFAPGYPDTLRPGPLLFTEREVTSAARVFGGKAFTGSAATERAFRQQSGVGILHLAAHGLPDDSQPLLSRLLLAPADTSEDGILHAYELYGLHLPAQLAVLSACHTAAGHFEQGEGMMSLERAFQYAGCAAMLSTFWAANDEAAATLTGWFLENLKNGMAKDEALQRAQLRFLEEGDPAAALPFYWAGLRLSGSVEALETGGLRWWAWCFLAAGLVFLWAGQKRWAKR